MSSPRRHAKKRWSLCLTGRLRLWEVPVAVQYFRAGTIETNHVGPSRRDRQAVGCFSIAAAELYLDCPGSFFLGSDVVERIGPRRIWLVVAFGVVHADRPESVDGHIPGAKLVDGFSVVPCRCEVEIGCILVRIATPGCRRAHQSAHGIHFVLGAERALEVRDCRSQDQKSETSTGRNQSNEVTATAIRSRIDSVELHSQGDGRECQRFNRIINSSCRKTLSGRPFLSRPA